MTAMTGHDPKTESLDRRESRKVLAGTLIGTTIEWYDYFIYAQAAGLVLAPLFFAPLGATGAQIASWASIAISFLIRPLGAIVAGHLGDRLGRKRMLVLTLILMGIGTSGISILPTYAQAGILATFLLILLRLVQGIAAGGEWGAATLMAVEYAPINKRGFFGAYPQIGVPAGMILATSTMLIVTTSMSDDSFSTWGWRVPFLISIVLIVVGIVIRRTIEESPVFSRLQERKMQASAPIRQLFQHHYRAVILASLSFIANNAAGYLIIAFFSTYAISILEMPSTEVLVASVIAAAGWLIFTMFGGYISDYIGRRNSYFIGYGLMLVWSIPLWLLIDTKSIVLFTVAIFILTIGLGLSYGPQAALFAEMFPSHVRYSGVSIANALGAVLGGAFAPTIAQALLDLTDASWTIGVYIAVLTVISIVAVILIPKSVERGNLEKVHDSV